MKIYGDLLAIVAEALQQPNYCEAPKNLTEPVDYIMSMGGKRLRPIICLYCCKLFGGAESQALPAALAIEIFHNFSLMHDDIMDKALLRRGKQTVHLKYDTDTAILSGDYMLVHAYQHLARLKPEILPTALKIFNEVAAGVCFGQQMDMDFEDRMDVTAPEYLRMIELKTSVLLAGSAQLGALAAGASEMDQQLIFDFAKNVGLSFQIQDDILDTFGLVAKFGKEIGGDIKNNKKTYLLIKALESGIKTKELKSWINDSTSDPQTKVQAVTALYKEIGVQRMAEQLKQKYLDKALQSLDKASGDAELKQELRSLALSLMKREN